MDPSHPSIDKAFPMSTTYIWQRRQADGTFDLWQEKLTGSVVPEEGAEVEIEGRPWRVIDTVPAPAQSLIRVTLEEAASGSPR